MQRDDIQSLTGLRGLAAWWVVIYHFRDPIAPYVSPLFFRFIELGYLAVDLFFILSGFVIYLNYHQDFESLTIANLKKFFIKRFARIYPLHITILIVYLVNPLAISLFSKVASLEGRYEFGYYILSVFLIQNWGFTHALMWNIPAWSISTETAAYLGFPFVVWMINKIKVHSTFVGVALFALAIATIALVFFAVDAPSLEDDIPGMGLFRCVLQFNLGMILCRVYLDHYSAIMARAWWFVFGFGLILWSGFMLGVPDFIFIPLAYSLLLLGMTSARILPAMFFGSMPIVFLGNISYSTYLVHYFVKDWVKFLSDDIGVVQFVIYITVTLVASVFLYQMVENPGRRIFTKLAFNQGKK